MSSLRRARAFTLIEVLIAGTITIIAVTSAAGALSMGFRFVAERKLRTTAEMVAQSHMELLLATAASRRIKAADCDAVRYTRMVVGEEDRSAVFTASCTMAENTPATPARKYTRLTAHVAAEIDGRDIHTSFATYLVAR